uniref:UBC core domain-containing protein n=1 Tax=Romanomermis culicivorax TaxID=13658 RepID=A0A915KXS4_ROMCU
MDAFARDQKEPIAGPSHLVTDSDFEDEPSSEIKSDIGSETDHSDSEDMDIDSQFFNTEFYIEMDLRKKKWFVKEIEFRKKLAVEQKLNWSKMKKARTSLKPESLFTVFNANADDGSSGNLKASDLLISRLELRCDRFLDSDDEKPEKEFPKQGQQIFKHKCATTSLSQEEGFECDTRDDSLYHWSVKISQFPCDSLLYNQLKELHSKFEFDYIQIHLDFLADYPFYPPSLRLVRPRFKGSLNQCLANIDLLKLKYWNPARSIREVLRKIREILVENAVIDVDFPGNSISTKRNGAYLPIEDYLIKLALTADIQPRANGASIGVDSLEKAPEVVHRSGTVTHPSTNEMSSDSTTGWKRGAGYGSGAVVVDRQWSPELLIKAREEKDQQLYSLILKICSSLINSDHLFALLCLFVGQTKCAAYYFEKLDGIIESGKVIVQICKDTAKRSTARNIAKAGQNESSDNELESENSVLLQQLWKEISRKLKERKWTHVPEPPKQENE